MKHTKFKQRTWKKESKILQKGLKSQWNRIKKKTRQGRKTEQQHGKINFFLSLQPTIKQSPLFCLSHTLYPLILLVSQLSFRFRFGKWKGNHYWPHFKEFLKLAFCAEFFRIHRRLCKLYAWPGVLCTFHLMSVLILRILLCNSPDFNNVVR